MDPNKNQNLQPQSLALSVCKTASLQVSAQILAAELKLTALNAKTDLDEFLISEFSRALVHLPPEAIQAAFREWRDVCPYFPAISDIRTLAQKWVRERAESERLRQDKEKLEAARAAGELVDFADIKTQLLEIAAFPADPTPQQIRQQKALSRLHRGEMPPALPLTKEQIEERRVRESEEIKHYKAQNE